MFPQLFFVILFFFGRFCTGKLAITNTDQSVAICETIDLKWIGGTAPFSLSIIQQIPDPSDPTGDDGGESGDILISFSSLTGRTQPWFVDLPPNITQVSVQVSDSDGETTTLSLQIITTDITCSSSTSSAVNTPTSVLAPSTSLQTFQSSTQSVSSSATVIGSNKKVSSPKELSASVSEIIGIAAGIAIGIVLAILGTFCFRRRRSKKTNRLEEWDGGYDSQSAFKTTTRYDSAPFRDGFFGAPDAMQQRNTGNVRSYESLDSPDSLSPSTAYLPPTPAQVPSLNTATHISSPPSSLYGSLSRQVPPYSPWSPTSLTASESLPSAGSFGGMKGYQASFGVANPSSDEHELVQDNRDLKIPTSANTTYSRPRYVVQEQDAGSLARAADIANGRDEETLPPAYSSIPRS